MAVPKRFVEENLKKAKGSTFFGVPLEDLTKEELMACLASEGNKQMEREIELKYRDRLFGIRYGSKWGDKL
jgi:hypothetical protein